MTAFDAVAAECYGSNVVASGAYNLWMILLIVAISRQSNAGNQSRDDQL
jgi:hypothetical protein